MRMKLIPLPALLLSLFLSSCFKKWTCTCSSYKVYFSDEFIDGKFVSVKDTTMQNSEMQFFGSKKKAKGECDRQLNSSRDHAISISADPNQVNCTLK